MSIKAAILGCGMIAGRCESVESPATYSHAKAYTSNSAYRGVAFYDLDESRADFLAEKYDGKAYTSAVTLLEDFRPDVVSICTPDNTHFHYIAMALQRGLPPAVIFAEKPICTTRWELDQMIEMQATSGSTVIVNHSRRFDSAHRRVKQWIESGELGNIVNVHVDYYGGWQHLGVHVVDTLQYLLNASLNLVKLSFKCGSKYATDPTLDVSGEIASAPTRLVGHREENYQILDMNLMFERGQIKLSDFGKRIEVLRKVVNLEDENVLETDVDASTVGMVDPMTAAVGLIARSIRTGDRLALAPYGLEEARKTMNTIWSGMEHYGN
jgi:predicted dehydrogenase